MDLFKHNNIETTYTLNNVLRYIKTLDPQDTIVFIDFDDTIIDADSEEIIEPETTIELIQ